MYADITFFTQNELMSLARVTRSITQQAEQPATSNIHAHRKDCIVTTKNHDTEAQQFPHLYFIILKHLMMTL
jgi:hypothetical protein